MTSWSKIFGLLMLFGVLTVAGVFWLKSRLTTHEFTVDTSTQQFIIGNDVLEIPLNLLRFASQRKKNVLNRADLVMYWVDGTGFLEVNRRTFLTPDGTQDLIFLTLSQRTVNAEMSLRLKPIYSKLLSGPPQQGPADLTLRKFTTGSGYDGEELAISAGGDPPWVARCQRDDQLASPTCMRDFFVGSGLIARYRFSRTLLPYWKEVEMLVSRKLSHIVATNK